MCRPNEGDSVLMRQTKSFKAMEGSSGIKPGTSISIRRRAQVLVEGSDPNRKDSYLILAECQHKGVAATLRTSVDHTEIQAP